MITLQKEDNVATAIRYINSKKLKNKYGVYCVWIKTSNLDGFVGAWKEREELYAKAKEANVGGKTDPKLPLLSGETPFEKDGYILLHIGVDTDLDSRIKAHMSIAETTSALKLFGANMKSKKLNAKAKQILLKDNKKVEFVDGIKVTYIEEWKNMAHIEATLHSEFKRLIGETSTAIDEEVEVDLTDIKKELGLI